MLQVLFLVLMVSGVPVAIAMAGASLIYIWVSGDMPPFVVVHRMIGGIDSFPLLAVPFFIFAGNLMNNAGITNRIYNFALALVGWLSGGLGHVNVVGSVIFRWHERHRHRRRGGARYHRNQGHEGSWLPDRVCGGCHRCLRHAGAHHPALLALRDLRDDGQCLGRRAVFGWHFARPFLALLMMGMVAYFAHRNGWGRDVRFSRQRFGGALIEMAVVFAWPFGTYWLIQAGLPARPCVLGALASLFVADRVFRFQAVLPIMTPVLLIGSMTAGIFTPTEGAVAASAWAMFLGFAWYRTLSWKLFVKICLETVGDDGDGDVHRRGVLHFGLDADGHGRDHGARGLGARVYAPSLGVLVAGQPVDVGGGLLSGADGGHYHPGAVALAHRARARRRPGASGAGDGAQFV